MKLTPRPSIERPALPGHKKVDPFRQQFRCSGGPLNTLPIWVGDVATTAVFNLHGERGYYRRSISPGFLAWVPVPLRR
jgi:hypothetical protein